MSDYKNIERELLGIGQAEMQNIVFQILDKQYAPTNIVNLGSASGVQTTRYGTPDVFLQLSNGNYIYAEVTIQKNQLLDKIKKDIAIDIWGGIIFGKSSKLFEKFSAHCGFGCNLFKNLKTSSCFFTKT